MRFLDFISDDQLIFCVEKVINSIKKAEIDAEKKLHKNVIDPFSALIDATYHDLSLENWLKIEKTRQVQKSMQNALGNLHEEILGNIDGWEGLGIGYVVDIRNRSRLIIAEVKNKYNTTKGNHKVEIYDDLQEELSKEEHRTFTGYYVEIIPKRKARYDVMFTPSDNRRRVRRMENERIRIIDGYSFYSLATGRPDALKELYQALPKVVAEIIGESAMAIAEDPLFMKLFNKAF